MKITRRQLRKMILEQMSMHDMPIPYEGQLQSSPSRLPASIVVTTSDGNHHTVVITDLMTGKKGDPAHGELDYTIDGEALHWEFYSGFHGEGAADHILGNLSDGFNDDLHDQLRDWVDRLELWRLQ